MVEGESIFKSKKAKLVLLLIPFYILLWIVTGWLVVTLGPYHPASRAAILSIRVLTILGIILGPIALIKAIPTIVRAIKESRSGAHKLGATLKDKLKEAGAWLGFTGILALLTYIFYCLAKATDDPLNPNNPIHMICLLIFVALGFYLVMWLGFLIVRFIVIALPLIALILPLFFHDSWVPAAQLWIIVIWILILPFHDKLMELFEK